MRQITVFTPVNDPMPYREGERISTGETIIGFADVCRFFEDRLHGWSWDAWSFWVQADSGAV